MKKNFIFARKGSNSKALRPVTKRSFSFENSMKWTMRYLPQIEVVKIPGMMHGEYVLMHPQAFAAQALTFLGGRE